MENNAKLMSEQGTPASFTTSRRAPSAAMVHLQINEEEHDVDAPPGATLLTVLREQLQMTGTKLVCDRGECGACTVLLDGEPAYSCLTLAAACEGHEVTTIEGIAGPDGLHPLQRAFMEHDALQCGFCTPGQIMAGVALLARNPNPTEDEVVRWMSGNLCRCGTYLKIVHAVLAAAEDMRGAHGS